MIKLFKRNGVVDWEFVGEFPNWQSLYDAHPEALEGLQGLKTHKVEMPERPTVKIEPTQPPPQAAAEPIPENERVFIRRHWNDWQVGTVSINNIDDLHWDTISGGINSIAPQPFIHGYIYCTDVQGEIAHSCLHGGGPHRIKVCVVKKDNSKEVWNLVHSFAGPKPSTNRPKNEVHSGDVK